MYNINDSGVSPSDARALNLKIAREMACKAASQPSHLLCGTLHFFVVLSIEVPHLPPFPTKQHKNRKPDSSMIEAPMGTIYRL